MNDSSHGIRIGSPKGQAGQAHAELGSTMQAVLKGEKLTFSRIKRSQQSGALIGLAAAATKETSAKIAGQDFCQLFGKIYERFGQIDRSGMLKRFDLPADSIGDFRVAVPKSMDAYAGVKVHILFPGRVVQIDSLPTYHLRRTFVEMVRTWNQIAPFLLKDGFRPYWFAL
jgi:hypothetical protein